MLIELLFKNKYRLIMFSNKRDLQSGNSSRMSDSTLRMQMK